MTEDRHAMYRRAVDALVSPPVEEFETWPFSGPVTPRALQPPVDAEGPRAGEGGADCRACAAPDARFIWSSERWRLKTLPEPTGLPLILLLEPRRHYQEPADLPDELAAEFGVIVAQVDRAMCAVDGVARVHVGRWGEGAAHLHWWFLARPAGFPQVASSMAMIWDDVLPPVPEEIWRENLAAFLAAFAPAR